MNLTDFHDLIHPDDLAELNARGAALIDRATRRPVTDLDRFAQTGDIVVGITGGTRLHLIEANGGAATLIGVDADPGVITQIVTAAELRALRIVDVTVDEGTYTVRFTAGGHPSGFRHLTVHCDNIDVSTPAR